MNQEPHDKLEVSSDVVEQLNGMVRNSAVGAQGRGPDMSPPGPAPNPTPKASPDYED